MSRQNLGLSPVRQKIRFKDRPHRSLDERVTARFPAIARHIAARLARMPPSSRLRQRFLARSVARAFAATKRGDLEFQLAAFYDPDVEWHGTIGGLDEGTLRRGHDEVMRGFDEYFAAWERLDLRPEEIIDTGDQVVVFVHEVARGRESGVVVETDTATISSLRDGMIVRVRGFMDRAEALEAVGLRE